jgi:endonuclease/exonuclease/phosphatase family metal-dependent hydrolase
MPRAGTTPYGPLVETSLRVATWNLWWQLGDWKARADAIAETLEELRPDVVCLQEVWQAGARNQAALLAERLGYRHAFALERSEDGVDQGLGLLSRWPLSDVEQRALPTPSSVPTPNLVLRAVVQGPRGAFVLASTHLVPYPFRSAEREEQVRAIVEFLAEHKDKSPFTVLAGDFNAAPDSDEIRLLNGRRPPVLRRWVFLDAWETAGDGSPGHTLTKSNPNSAPLLLPNLRWDYILVTWPSGSGGVGHPLRAEVAGSAAKNGVVPSDHYAVVTDLRY